MKNETRLMLVPSSVLDDAASAINYYLEPDSPDEHDYTWRELRHMSELGLGLEQALAHLCVKARWVQDSDFTEKQWVAIYHELIVASEQLKKLG